MRLKLSIPKKRWYCPGDGKTYRIFPKNGLCRSCRSSLRLLGTKG